MTSSNHDKVYHDCDMMCEMILNLIMLYHFVFVRWSHAVCIIITLRRSIEFRIE